MKHWIRMLSLVAALGIVFGSPAAAMAGTFKFESSPSWVKGEQATQLVITVSGGTIKCSSAVFTSGELVGTSLEKIEATPSLTGCTAFGQAATVHTNGCTVEWWRGPFGGWRWRHICPTTLTSSGLLVKDKTVVTAPTSGCQIEIPEQETGTGGSYTNSGSGASRAVTLTHEVTGLSYTSSGGICGASGSNGTIKGSVLVKAYGTSSFTSQHGIWAE